MASDVKRFIETQGVVNGNTYSTSGMKKQKDAEGKITV